MSKKKSNLNVVEGEKKDDDSGLFHMAFMTLMSKDDKNSRLTNSICVLPAEKEQRCGREVEQLL